MKDLATRVLDAARARGIMIATAESCTGGMISAALTAIPGSSSVVERGFTTYSNAAKTEMLGVPAEMIAAHGAVSEEVARAMAEGALAHSHAQLAVSVTGIAGPGGSEHKPEGRVCFGLASGMAPGSDAADDTFCETVEFGAIGRDAVRTETCRHALQILLRKLEARS